MAKEKVLKPEIELIKTNEFYLFYEMMMQSLKTDNVIEEISNPLYMLRTFLKSGNIVLYKKNKDGIYVYKMSDSKTGELGNLLLLHIGVDNDENECILAIANNNKSKELESQFWERVKDTIKVILKRASSYKRNTKAISTDLLTGLDNRNSYESRLSSINKTDKGLVLGIFDMFRLKFINDNYSHAMGDIYIKEVAKILNKYWPKHKVKINSYSAENFVDTGHCVYRIGGDEFVLLTSIENLKLTKLKARCVCDEASMIDFNVDENLPLRLNFGIAEYNPNNSIKQTFIQADEIVQSNKRQMYKKYNLDRRR